MKVAVFTSTRADYGLLRPLVHAFKNQKIEVSLFVTGTHLSQEYGMTVHEVEQEFATEIAYRVPFLNASKSELRNLDVMSDALFKYATVLSKNRPDMMIILGDRYEALCCALACAVQKIPLAHIHGGEITLGALDDKFRHCLTKLSEWHFVACEKYRERVVQMGETPDRVWNVGALGVENAVSLKLVEPEKIRKELGMDAFEEQYLLTFHPETYSQDFGSRVLTEFLHLLEKRLISANGGVVVTGVNSDSGHEVIRKILMEFVNKIGPRGKFIESLGSLRYFSAAKAFTAVVGNSSSGVLEAHAVGTPAINIGCRQEGRERETSVFDFIEVAELQNLDFDKVVACRDELKKTGFIAGKLGDGNTSMRIAQVIKSLSDKLPVSPKLFYDK